METQIKQDKIIELTDKIILLFDEYRNSGLDIKDLKEVKARISNILYKKFFFV